MKKFLHNLGGALFVLLVIAAVLGTAWLYVDGLMDCISRNGWYICLK